MRSWWGALSLTRADGIVATKGNSSDRRSSCRPPLMGDFGQWVARETASPPQPETAFTAHERLVTIHPFSDGNGRTARLLMNLLLLRADYPPIVIGPDHRTAYLDSLQAIQIDGDAEPYLVFMSDRLEASLDHHIDMLRRGPDR